MMPMKKDILDMASLSVEEIQAILDMAETMREISERPIKKVPTLRGKAFMIYWSWDKEDFGVRWSRLGDMIH